MPAEPAYVLDMPPPPPALMTANELLHVRIPEKRAELVRGKLVVREPAGLRHGRVAMDLARRLADHVDARGLGQVYAAETGFALARDPRPTAGRRGRGARLFVQPGGDSLEAEQAATDPGRKPGDPEAHLRTPAVRG